MTVCTGRPLNETEAAADLFQTNDSLKSNRNILHLNEQKKKKVAGLITWGNSVSVLLLFRLPHTSKRLAND